MPCPTCGLDVAGPSASTCPHCGRSLTPGAPVSKRRSRRRAVRVVGALLVVAGTVALFVACGASHGVVYQNTFAAQADDWANSTSCFLGAGGYHVGGGPGDGRAINPHIAAGCDVPTDSLADVDISVQVSQITGAYSAGQGMYFRQGRLGNTGYVFALDSSGVWWSTVCATKLVGVRRGGPATPDCHFLTAPTATEAAHVGLSATNTLEVRAKGSHFEFFVNGVKVGSADDDSNLDGYIQLVVGPENESVFSNLVITTPS